MVTLLDIFNQFGLESKLSDGLNQLELGEHLVIKEYEYRKGKLQKSYLQEIFIFTANLIFTQFKENFYLFFYRKAISIIIYLFNNNTLTKLL